MVELRCLRRQTSFDVAQAIPAGVLCNGQTSKLLGTTQVSYAVVAEVNRDDSAEGGPGYAVHELGEQLLAGAHRSIWASGS
jgi:hypothetical protein